MTRNLYEYFNDNCSDHHLSSHILATSFIMVKRKETVDPATPAAPAVKKPRISSAAGTRANPATTPKPLVATKVPTMTPALQSTTKNPSYSFGTPPTNETIVHALDYCVHTGFRFTVWFIWRLQNCLKVSR